MLSRISKAKVSSGIKRKDFDVSNHQRTHYLFIHEDTKVTGFFEVFLNLTEKI